MADPQAILAAAWEVRRELEALLPPEEARRVGAELEALLAGRADDDAARAAEALLRAHPETRAWLDAWLADWKGPPPRIGSNGGGGPSPPPAAPAPDFSFAFPAPPSAPPPAPARNGGPATVYALVECPDVVVAREAFTAEVGVTDRPLPEVAGTEMRLPSDDLVVVVHVTADGFSLAPGEAWRRELRVRPGAPLPTVTLTLTAEPQAAPQREARLQALFMVAGQVIGFGSRALVVARDRAALAAAAPAAGEGGALLTLPVGAVAPDLTATIRKGRWPGELQWVFDTAHGLDVPDEPVITSIGQAPDEYARQLVLRANQREGNAAIFPFLRGIGKEVADHLPAEMVGLLHAVAARVGGPPLVQLLSEDPYVPWELAWIDPPLDPAAPAFLAAQATVGRWVLARRPPSPPPALAQKERMVVVWGVYQQPGWRRLLEAEAEAAELQRRWHATPVPAEVGPVLAAIEGDPAPDILHFAVHGNYDPTGGQDGLVLTDRRTLDPTEVGGLTARGAPFVFLNACQVGSGREVLGDYAGMAQAFLRAGASGVVAPLWSIDDALAKQVALGFYERALAGDRPAEVLREQRAAITEASAPTSGTHLAYQFFGHPAMRLGGAT